MRSPDRAHLLLAFSRIRALFAQLADLRRLLIALRFQLFALGDALPALPVQSFELPHIQRESARAQAVPNLLQIVAEKSKVVHP